MKRLFFTVISLSFLYMHNELVAGESGYEMCMRFEKEEQIRELQTQLETVTENRDEILQAYDYLKHQKENGAGYVSSDEEIQDLRSLIGDEVSETIESAIFDYDSDSSSDSCPSSESEDDKTPKWENMSLLQKTQTLGDCMQDLKQRNAVLDSVALRYKLYGELALTVQKRRDDAYIARLKAKHVQDLQQVKGERDDILSKYNQQMRESSDAECSIAEAHRIVDKLKKRMNERKAYKQQLEELKALIASNPTIAALVQQAQDVQTRIDTQETSSLEPVLHKDAIKKVFADIASSYQLSEEQQSTLHKQFVTEFEPTLATKTNITLFIQLHINK